MEECDSVSQLNCISLDNDFVDMSIVNILSAQHPFRKTNMDNYRNYNPEINFDRERQFQATGTPSRNIGYPRAGSFLTEVKVASNLNTGKGAFNPVDRAKSQIQQAKESKPATPLIGGSKKSSTNVTKNKSQPPTTLLTHKHNDDLAQKARKRNQNKTYYSTFLPGQLYEAKSSVDNYSQVDAFFNCVNRNMICMQERTPQAFPMSSGPSKLKKFQNTPFASRSSMIGLKKLPKPTEEIQRIIEEDVYQHHHESSDDELLTDQAYQEASKNLVHELIYSLNDGHIENIYENIINVEYKKVKAKGQIQKDTMPQLKEKFYKGKPPQQTASPLGSLPTIQEEFGGSFRSKKKKATEQESIIKRGGQSFKTRQTVPHNLAKDNFIPRKTTKMLIGNNQKFSNKALCLQNDPIEQDEFYEDSNKEMQSRTGLPNIRRFYENFKQADKRVQLGQTAKHPQIAYIETASKFQMIPKPIVAQHKGSQKDIDLRFKSIGNEQAHALGSYLSVSTVERVNLAGNRLLPSGAMAVISNINRDLKELNLSDNHLNSRNTKKDKEKLIVRKMPKDLVPIKPGEEEYHPKSIDIHRSLTKKVAVHVDSQDEFDDAEPVAKEKEPNPCIESLCKKIMDKRLQLQCLYLNRCELEDDDVINIIGSINVQLTKLYLNNNSLTKVSALHIAEFVDYSDIKLKELGLKWNEINGEGGIAIAEALENNKFLKILDLSWNNIGRTETYMSKGLIGKTWGKALKENKTLVHLDLGFNKIGEDDTQIFAEDLKKNQTCIGIHYQGNTSSQKSDDQCGKMDSLGFIKMMSNKKQDPTDPHLVIGLPSGNPLINIKHRTQNYPMKKKVNKKNVVQYQYKKFGQQENKTFVKYDSKIENCWICEEWIECSFQINIEDLLCGVEFDGIEFKMEDALDKKYHVYMHFDFDDFNADQMDDMRDQNTALKGLFRLDRMVPQGYFHYFFSYLHHHPEDPTQAPTVYTFVNNRADVLDVMSYDQKEMFHQYFEKENRYAFKIENFIEQLNQVNTIAMKLDLIEKENQEREDETKSEQERIEENMAEVENLTEKPVYVFESPFKRRGSMGEEETPPHRHMQLPALQSDNMSNADTHVLADVRPITSNTPINNRSKTPMPGLAPMANTQSTFGFGQTQKLGGPMDKSSSFNPFHQQQNTDSQLVTEQAKKTFKFPDREPKYFIMDPVTYDIKIKSCQIRALKNCCSKVGGGGEWTVEMGIFKKYLRETNENMIRKCFENDWELMKDVAKKYKHSEEKDMKDKMWIIWKQIKDLYRDQAGYTPNGNTFCISQNQLELCMSQILNLFDEEETDFLHVSKAGIIAASVKVTKVKSPYVCKNEVVRFQFLEYIKRCAIKKYFESGKCPNELDAIQLLIDNHFRKYNAAKFDQALWRQQNTFNVYVDNCIKAHLKIFEHVYDKFSGKHTLPGMKSKYMMVDEFDDFCQMSGVLNDLMTQQIIPYLFNISMLTQEDEIEKGTHLQASLLEFLEMCVRIANEGSYRPASYRNEEGELVESDMSPEERKAQPLEDKIRNMIPILLQNVCDAKFKAKWATYPLAFHQDKNLYFLESGSYF